VKVGRKLKIVLIVIGAIVVFALGLAGWAYIDVVKYRELVIKDVDLRNIPDGVYEGTFKGGRFSNSLEVTVKDHRIVDIKRIGSRASVEDLYQKIYAKVIESQSLQIDTVSGATVTTRTTLKAIENALLK
jgi:uncharacterized protein with FMN-binding domain